MVGKRWNRAAFFVQMRPGGNILFAKYLSDELPIVFFTCVCVSGVLCDVALWEVEKVNCSTYFY